MDYRTSAFQDHRPKLYGIAYRMLGIKADAEDALQDAFLRWYQADVERVRSPEAWLTTTVAHLCIDRLRARRARREECIGPWLPEPLIGNQPPPQHPSGSSDVSMAFLVMLERLAPAERAAFLLHDVFDYDYPEISSALHRSPASVRQIVHRARGRVRREERRFPVSEDAHRRLLERFLAAFRTADRQALLALLSDEATWTADSGGKTPAAARKVVHGGASIARLLAGVGRRLEPYGDRLSFHFAPINGEMGVMSFLERRPMLAMLLVTDGRQVSAGFVVLNPDKLARVPADLLRSGDRHVTEVSSRPS